NAKQTEFVRATFEKELTKFPMESRAALKAAFDAPADKQTEEQKKLVASNPKLNITPGVLYQYDPAAADVLQGMNKKLTAKQAQRPVEDFVSITDEVPGVVPVTKVFYRGDYRQPKGEVLPGDLTIAAPEGKRLELPAKDASLPGTGRRLALAKHLTSG